ncbi:GMC oxidoreductase [Athelia psychrophila]|uniref:GMC oxidoreductase n=1 Tax=Athelia psychrophila TaxID=1759441 RepID=A0A166XDK7_9AGAM|nr:GMC oxidoreductase [Fibularhizoctonia sp. CBS 109695]
MPNGSFWPGEYKPSAYASPAGSKGESVRKYDYIIVGGGTAGAVLANRLTADGKHTVLVLEAGYSDSRQVFSRIPAAFPFLFQKDADWFYETEPQPNLNNRRMFWPRGKMLGGCSSMNAMIYQRCSPDTYNDWAAQGNEGWDWAHMQPYFEKSERFLPSADFPTDKVHHAGNGPWKTRAAAFTSPVTRAIIGAGDAIGVPKIDDLNNPNTQVGSARLQSTVDENGRRHSTSQAFLTKDVRRRKNLTIGVGVLTTKILFSDDRKRAIGVEFAQKKGTAKRYVVHATKEVLVCTGSINTPQLLMLSGVGPAAELATHKIPLVADLPGVGQNMADHLACSAVYYTKCKSLEHLKHEIKSGPAVLQWVLAGKGGLTSNVAESALFFRHEDLKGPEEPSLDVVPPPGAPDIEIIGASVNYINHTLDKLPARDSVTLIPIHLDPTSRGTITLKDTSPWSAPRIDPNYCATENDRRAMLFGMKTAIKLAATEPLKGQIHMSFDFKKPKALAHLRGKGEFADLDDAALEALWKDTSSTLYHPTGTAKMGLSSDARAVVDARLRVHGIAGLRVVDASIMPTIVRGHPQAAVVAIAEKAADMIMEDVKLSGGVSRSSASGSQEEPGLEVAGDPLALPKAEPAA